MDFLLPTHSHTRFLVLLAGVVFLGVVLLGTMTRRPATKLDRITGAIFTGLMDLQVLVGLGLLATGHFQMRLLWHILVMLAAVALAHVSSVLNRRRTATSFSRFPVIGLTVTLCLLVAGVHLTGKGLFQVH